MITSFRKSAAAVAIAITALCTVAAANDSRPSALPALPALPAFPQLPPPTPLDETTVGDIYFETRSPYDFDVLLNHYPAARTTTGMGRLFLPAAASARRRVAAMVLLHGSGGISPGREMEYGEWLAANGYAALVIDYYRPRGVVDATPYAVKVLAVTEFDAVADAYAGLRALSTHPAVDASRIGLMGFSYGGISTRLAMDERVRQRLAPDVPAFAAHVDFYGPCYQDFGTRKTTGAPLLSLRGGEDASNDLMACAQTEAALRRAGSAVGSVIYAGAGHAWEVQRPRRVNDNPYIAGCTMVYDPTGLPFVGGEALLPADADIDREQRYRLRAASGRFFGNCVRAGYIVGRDELVKPRADHQLLLFLGDVLGR